MLTLKRLTVVPLLTEMDGFDGNIGVSVLAATNRSDVIDAATNPPPPEKSLLWIVSSVWVSSSERCGSTTEIICNVGLQMVRNSNLVCSTLHCSTRPGLRPCLRNLV